MVISGFIPTYLLAEYVILTRENISTRWNKVLKFAFEPQAKISAFDFEGPERLKTTSSLENIANVLKTGKLVLN